LAVLSTHGWNPNCQIELSTQVVGRTKPVHP
jgi:hypothetical protein